MKSYYIVWMRVMYDMFVQFEVIQRSVIFNVLSLLRIWDINKERFDAAVRIGCHKEDENAKEEAREIYQSVVGCLEEKEKKNFLFPWEFFSLCTAYKRMGVMSYRSGQSPGFENAIRSYKKIYLLWSRCGENKFITCFDKEYQPDIVDYFRN